MANEGHVSILRMGTERWNEWRAGNSDIKPDLYGANLRGLELSGAKLDWVDLSDADLSGAILKQARFLDASLGGVDMSNADLTGANFGGANLSYADLSGANLSRANLTGANLRGAELSEVDLHAAEVGYTIFADVDLSSVKSLDSVTHDGPSSIGIDTLYLSRPNIPEVFLRRAGVPNEMIVLTKLLMGLPIEYYSVFISYSSPDQEFANRLHADLEAKGIRCWLATEDLKIGDKFRTRIEESIRLHDKVLLVLSEASIASPWVEDEVESALERERRENRLVLFPVRLDDAVFNTDVAWAVHLRQKRHIGHFKHWKDYNPYWAAFERLVRDLQAPAGNGQG